tara:strand:+ start:87 stop:713 length:627 start_codon:yes stop_codon:yes gene_type:complete
MSDTVWFGTLIREEFLDIDIKPIIDFVYQKKNELPNSNYGSSLNSWQSPDLKDNAVFEPLKQKIFKNLDEFSEVFLLKKDKDHVISNIWANINPFGGSNMPHNHPGALFSGVFYLQCNDDSGDLCFTHPAMNQNYHFNDLTVRDFNNINSGGINLTPKVGKMILFPSYQYHYVRANMTQQDRITLAFNTQYLDKDMLDKFNSLNNNMN